MTVALTIALLGLSCLIILMLLREILLGSRRICQSLGHTCLEISLAILTVVYFVASHAWFMMTRTACRILRVVWTLLQMLRVMCGTIVPTAQDTVFVLERNLCKFGHTILPLFLGALLERGSQVEENWVGIGEVVKLFQVDEHPIHAWQVVFLRLLLLRLVLGSSWATTHNIFWFVLSCMLLNLMLIDWIICSLSHHHQIVSCRLTHLLMRCLIIDCWIIIVILDGNTLKSDTLWAHWWLRKVILLTR